MQGNKRPVTPPGSPLSSPGTSEKKVKFSSEVKTIPHQAVKSPGGDGGTGEEEKGAVRKKSNKWKLWKDRKKARVSALRKQNMEKKSEESGGSSSQSAQRDQRPQRSPTPHPEGRKVSIRK